ncbi:XRE family transcriptional regulator [Variovorax sp. YR566]|uniref:XRE family transcriptional regulator n=1 Tax=Variovorax sp. YR566 TaxID=3450237 RepID=UPI003F7CF8C2
MPNIATFLKAEISRVARKEVRAEVEALRKRGWQQWEAGDRAMPPGLFELFMLKAGQWPLDGNAGL